LRRNQTAEGSTVVRVHEVAALTMRTLRLEYEMTQEGLAEAMRDLGFVAWKRITVAEIESFKRRLSLEELFGVAIVFGTDVVSMLSAYDKSEAIELNERHVLTAVWARVVVTGSDIGAPPFGVRLQSETAFRQIREMTGTGTETVGIGRKALQRVIWQRGTNEVARLAKPEKAGESVSDETRVEEIRDGVDR
jgi:transcriptional regulator with XRE-family HTH domain